MPRKFNTLTLSDAKHIIEAGEAKAASIGIAYNIAVVDAGGALVAFSRQDGALIGSIDLAIGKAVTARLFDKTTAYLSELAQPGAPLFGIEHSNGGRVIIFGGGAPVRIGVKSLVRWARAPDRSNKIFRSLRLRSRHSIQATPERNIGNESGAHRYSTDRRFQTSCVGAPWRELRLQ